MNDHHRGRATTATTPSLTVVSTLKIVTVSLVRVAADLDSQAREWLL
jgi:hypothetical protein